mgnify:CR=1 FL=1
MVGKKIRAYREFRGYSQIQLAELSGINVGTIRKYELGIRNPKPDQLEKIATALGLNVSVFLDFNIETVGDVLSLLFSIDDSVNLSLAETPDQKVALTFDNPTMQDFFRKWCQFKNVYEKEKAEILAIEDEDKRQAELDKLNATQDEWKLRAMGTTIGCHTIVKKGTEGNDIKTYNLTYGGIKSFCKTHLIIYIIIQVLKLLH